ncbi:unknown [Megasphaera elsdenii CAG:570]|uniref:Uncharacterized protein n=1 Tax=Megasphaera elsdenii CAG:570 TaxID=1263087 RepID=R7MTY7_MEGEL|nr:unknown [Megasphaera elsdenii CAG:570]
MFVVDDGQRIVGYDDTVASTETSRDPPGKVQPLLNQDQRVPTDSFGSFDLLHHILCIFIGTFGHLFIKERESLRRICRITAQCRQYLIFAETVSIGSLQSKFAGCIRKFGAFLRRRRAGQPAITGGSGKDRVFSRHVPSPPILPSGPDTWPHPRQKAYRHRTSG